MLCLPSQVVVDEENSSFLTVVSESEGDSSFPPRHVHSSQQRQHHQNPTTVSNSSTLMNNNNSSSAHPPPAMGKFAQIPLEESQEYASVTASPGTSRRSHLMMPSQRTSPTSDDDFGLSSTHPDALRTRTASTSHHLTHSVSMLRMSSHTFVSSNLPNLSFSHVAHNSSLSSQSGVPVIHHQSHEKERDVSPPAPVRGLARPQRTEPRTRPLLFIAHPNELDDHIHRPPKAQPAANTSQRSPTTTNTIGSPSLLLASSRGADYDNDHGFLVEVKAPTFSPEVMLTPRVRRTTTVVPPPPTEVESEVPSFEDDIFSTFGIRQGGVSHRKQSHAKTTATTAGVVETSSARERSLQLHKARIEHLRGKQEASNVRQQQAQERRQFLADHQNLRQAASWSVMMLLALSVSPLQRLAHDLTARRRRRQRMGGVLIYPVVMLGMRRSLRRARQRILSRVESYERPSHVTLRNDKILGLFPELVLRSAAKSMTLRYFFPNEAILFVKCEDDEAYVLASGTADVMIGSSKVFTMQPGMVFGTIGMISGEPRSASIFARGEGVMGWVMKRAVFDAAGDSAAVSAAHDALAEVRQKNIMNVYKSRLDPPALGTFPLFYGLSNETLQGLLLGATPRIVRRGKVLAEPDQPMSVVSHMILLKGRVTIKVSPTPVHIAPRMHPLHGNEEKFSLAGEFRNAVDIPLKIENGKHPALLLAARMDPGATVRRGVRRASITLPGFADDVSSKGEYSVSAPALLNVNPLFLPGGGMMRPTPFIMTAATDCDLLCLSRKTLRTIDMLELATMQQNALNAHADFLGVQTKRDAAMMLLDNIAPMFSLTPSSQGVIATLRNSTGESMIGSMKLEKWVYPRGGYICFGTSNEFLVNIVLEGELEAVGTPQATTTSSRFPVWPSLADVWFAARDSVIRTTKRTVCLRIPRRDILAWFCRSLPDPQDLRTACSIFANNVSSVGGGSLACVLGFSTFDLDQMPCVLEDSSNSSAQTPLEMSRLARSSRGYSISFDVSETTVAAILRPVLQQIAEQLNRLQQRSSPQQGSAVTPTSAGGRGMHHKPTLTPRSPSSVPKSPMLNPANIYEASGITGHVSPLSIGVANKSTLVPGNGSSPTASSARRPSSAAIRRPSSAVKTSLYPQPTVTVTTPSDPRSPNRSDGFMPVSKMDSGASNNSNSSSATMNRTYFREVSKMDSGNNSGYNSAGGGNYKNGAPQLRESGKVDGVVVSSAMPPASPMLNPSPRSINPPPSSRSQTKAQKVASSSSVAPPTVVNVVDAYLESKRSNTTQPVQQQKINGFATTSIVNSFVITNERNLPVQHRVDLDALRGKSNRRHRPAVKSN